MTKDLLVVDDQPGIRLLLTDILTNEGYHVTTASDGKEALEILSEKKFSLLILDYNLPMVNGIKVLEEIGKMADPIPTIVMSGLVEKIENDLETLPHVKKVLAKPFNIQEIPIIVKRIL